MTSLYFGMLRSGVPADEKVVRTTAEPYEADAPPAVMDSTPEAQEVFTDKNPDLGMTSRQVASYFIPGQKGVPEWLSNADAGTEHNAIVDRQVATSGTAAARESRGEWGHGTMPVSIGIEPVSDLREGGKMGNEYFVRTPRDIQETADDTMMSIPPGYDQGIKGSVTADGKQASRESAMASAYNMFWNGGN
jgi:hypothetical protein